MVNISTGSLPGRGNINIEIYGMEGIPAADMIAHEQKKALESGYNINFKLSIGR